MSKDTTPVQVTDADLQAAWATMKARGLITMQTRSMQEAWRDPLARSLIRMYATASVRAQREGRPALVQQPVYMHPALQVPEPPHPAVLHQSGPIGHRPGPAMQPRQPDLFDRKRAAAGDND